MKKLKVLFLVFVLTACAQQRIYHSQKYSKANPNYENMDAFFIYGIGQTKETDAATICKKKGGVDKTETIQTFVDGLLSAITFGIFFPRTVKVYCKS